MWRRAGSTTTRRAVRCRSRRPAVFGRWRLRHQPGTLAIVKLLDHLYGRRFVDAHRRRSRWQPMLRARPWRDQPVLAARAGDGSRQQRGQALSGLPSTSTGQFSGVGTAAINQGTLANANYSITYTGADLSITPKRDHGGGGCAEQGLAGDANPSPTGVATCSSSTTTRYERFAVDVRWPVLGQSKRLRHQPVVRSLVRNPTRSPILGRRSVDHTEGDHGGSRCPGANLRRSFSTLSRTLMGDRPRQQRHAALRRPGDPGDAVLPNVCAQALRHQPKYSFEQRQLRDHHGCRTLPVTPEDDRIVAADVPKAKPMAMSIHP